MDECSARGEKSNLIAERNSVDSDSTLSEKVLAASSARTGPPREYEKML